VNIKDRKYLYKREYIGDELDKMMIYDMNLMQYIYIYIYIYKWVGKYFDLWENIKILKISI